MAKLQVVREGFLSGKRVPRPKPSPDGFAWPNARTVDEETKLKFRTRLIEELRARGMTHRDLAVLAHGEVVRNGNVVPRQPAPARTWVFGTSFPNAESADGLAGYFKISTAELLQPAGELRPMAKLRKGGEHTRTNGNGHDAGAAAHSGNGVDRGHEPPPPPLALPEGAPPVLIKLESYNGDPRFMTVSITGTLLVDEALALAAMVHPKHA